MRAEATTRTDASGAGPERALAERARAFDLAMFERAADELVRGDRFTLFRTPSLPRVPSDKKPEHLSVAEARERAYRSS